jgi:hypothetical protein
MDYLTALDAVIARGIEAARRDYKDSAHKRDGAVAGFNACRGKTPVELEKLREEASAATTAARNKQLDDDFKAQDYWKTRCYEAEIEWVCNCVAAILFNQKQPSPFPRHVGPTARAMATMARIIGVDSPN